MAPLPKILDTKTTNSVLGYYNLPTDLVELRNLYNKEIKDQPISHPKWAFVALLLENIALWEINSELRGLWNDWSSDIYNKIECLNKLLEYSKENSEIEKLKAENDSLRYNLDTMSSLIKRLLEKYTLVTDMKGLFNLLESVVNSTTNNPRKIDVEGKDPKRYAEPIDKYNP